METVVLKAFTIDKGSGGDGSGGGGPSLRALDEFLLLRRLAGDAGVSVRADGEAAGASSCSMPLRSDNSRSRASAGSSSAHQAAGVRVPGVSRALANFSAGQHTYVVMEFFDGECNLCMQGPCRIVGTGGDVRSACEKRANASKPSRCCLIY